MNIINKDRPHSQFLAVINAETVSIPSGSVVYYNMNGTRDGADVVLPSTGGVAKNHLIAGITLTDASANEASVRTQAYGFCNRAMIRTGTRAASSDSWATFTSMAIGDVLGVDTVNNCLSRAAAGADSNFLAKAVLCQTVASVAGSASATSDTRTALTTMAKVFLRMM